MTLDCGAVGGFVVEVVVLRRQGSDDFRRPRHHDGPSTRIGSLQFPTDYRRSVGSRFGSVDTWDFGWVLGRCLVS